MQDFSIDESVITIRYKVVIIGDVAVGKSSLVTRLSSNHFKDGYEPSIGVDFANKSIKFKDKLVKMQIWDTAGQEKFKSLIPSYLRGSNIVIIMFDMTNKQSFNNISKWISFLKDVSTSSTIVIVGNKSDLLDKITVSKEEIEHFEQSFNYKVHVVSVKTNDNISKMFYNAISDLPIFEKYLDKKEELIDFIEAENKDETSFITLDRRENSMHFNLETSKKEDDNNENAGNQEFSIKINHKEKFAVKQRKCKC